MRPTPAAFLRRFAQRVRHHPRLSRFEALWNLLRRPYRSALRVLARRNGLPVYIAGCGMRLHSDFAAQNWETVEAESYAAFRDGVAEGDVVFDIGAHIGTYSLVAAMRAGATGRIVAYEPLDQTRAYLRTHLEWNGVSDRTVVRDVCCSAAVGMAEFFYGPGAEGMNGLLPVSGFASKKVSVVTVDSEVRNLGLTPTVMKIDVEGAELDVLKGAEETLRSARPRLFISIHPEPLNTQGASEGIVLDWLTARGYACRVIARDHEVHVVALSIRDAADAAATDSLGS